MAANVQPASPAWAAATCRCRSSRTWPWSARRRVKCIWPWACRPTNAWTGWSRKPPNWARPACNRCRPSAACCVWPASVPTRSAATGRAWRSPPASNAAATACRRCMPCSRCPPGWPAPCRRNACCCRCSPTASRWRGGSPRCPAAPVVFLSGPEGGLSPAEEQAARAQGFVAGQPGRPHPARRDRTPGRTGRPYTGGMNHRLLLLAVCQGLFLTNNVVFIAINGLVGLSLAPLGWMATLPVMGYVVGGALSTGLVARTQARYGRQASFQIGLLVALLSALLCAYAAWSRNFWLLVAATWWPATTAPMASSTASPPPSWRHPAHREKAVSLVLAGGLIGAVIGPNLAKYTKGLLATPFRRRLPGPGHRGRGRHGSDGLRRISAGARRPRQAPHGGRPAAGDHAPAAVFRRRSRCGPRLRRHEPADGRHTAWPCRSAAIPSTTRRWCSSGT